jgi:4-diphosphocytidyl-2-C-methyl-D-erythritol kinase
VSRLAADAPAKINLALAVTGVRGDGYHTLRSVFLRLELHDRLEVEVRPAADSDSLEVDGAPDTAGDNLVSRAAAHLRAAIDPSLPTLHFRLYKRIPAAAGLGGGSSDAAAALDLALAAWGVRVHPADRLGAALRVGADVPFFAAGHAASLVTGIGEHISRLPAPKPALGIVLITPRARLSTAAVFAEFDRQPSSGALEPVDELAELLRAQVDGQTLAATTARLGQANDLWAPAVRLLPGLAALRDLATSILGRTVLLTGSGPTLVAVYPSEAAAKHAAGMLESSAAPELEGATIISTSTIRSGEEP